MLLLASFPSQLLHDFKIKGRDVEILSIQQALFFYFSCLKSPFKNWNMKTGKLISFYCCINEMECPRSLLTSILSTFSRAAISEGHM
jgi:hypothetical protein